MRKLADNRGSILIWTMLLGLSLATVFFFFSQRLNRNLAVQRDTIRYMNAQMLIESYADYVENLVEADLESLRDSGISFEEVIGTVTNTSTEITGTLDVGESIQYEVAGGSADVTLTPFGGGTASSSEETGVFSIQAGQVPLNYLITPIGSAILYDNEWHLDLSLTTTTGKVITLKRSFDK